MRQNETAGRTSPTRTGKEVTTPQALWYGELCEALELARCTLQADHFRFFTSNHSRPVAATSSPAITDHGVDEAGSSLDAGREGVGSDAFFGANGGGLIRWPLASRT